MFSVTSHKLFLELLRDEDRKVLMEQMRRRSATVNLSAKPLPSFYDIPGTERLSRRLPVSAQTFSVWDGSPCSLGQRERGPAGAAAHPDPRSSQDQADPHRAPRHGGAALLEGQQQGQAPPTG